MEISISGDPTSSSFTSITVLPLHHTKYHSIIIYHSAQISTISEECKSVYNCLRDNLGHILNVACYGELVITHCSGLYNEGPEANDAHYDVQETERHSVKMSWRHQNMMSGNLRERAYAMGAMLSILGHQRCHLQSQVKSPRIIHH